MFAVASAVQPRDGLRADLQAAGPRRVRLADHREGKAPFARRAALTSGIAVAFRGQFDALWGG